MTTLFECRNKWENQYVKKRNRKKSPSKRVRKWRQTHGRSTNSLKRPSNDSPMRQKRMIQMKYNKAICQQLINDEIYYTNDDIISIEYNSIPIWTCLKCNYTNIERGLNCKICDAIYTSTHCQPNNHITLAEFWDIENECDLLSVPVWICSQCTYRNIERLSLCQICEYSYDYQSKTKNKRKKTKQNKKSKSTSVQSEWHCPQCTLINSTDSKKCILCNYTKTSNKSDKNKSNIISNKCQYDINVELKLNTNCWFHGIKSFKNNTTYYGLSECNLTMNNISYTLIPTTCGRSSNYKPLSNVIVPIGYNNNPLKSVAALAWSSRFNRFDTLKVQWNEPKINELNTLNFCHSLLQILMQFIPSYDVCKTILFEYIQIFVYIKDIPDGCLAKYKQQNGEWCDAKIIKHKKSPRKRGDAWRKLPKCKQNVDSMRDMVSIQIQERTWWDNWLATHWVNFTPDMMCFCEKECNDNMHIIKDNNCLFSFYCDVSRKYVVTINGSISLNKNVVDIKRDNDNKIKLFMKKNHGKFPLRLNDTKLCTIRERYYDRFNCFEIGFKKHDI